MEVKFEIEANLKLGKGKNTKYFVFAKCLDVEKDFSVTANSKLGGIEISNYLNQPRALDKEGKARLDVFVFKIRYKKDCDKLKEGQIVELTHDHELK